jgi:parallel beta-helix repeat protein
MTIRDNRLLNVNFGISVEASDSLISGNLVENFAGDGLRGLGNHCTFQYNTVKNCYKVNANHDDGFQSWSTGPNGVGSGEVVGVVLRGNTIINYDDPNQPYRGTLQGIGCFDGTFVDWVIENNVIITDHWHGITLGGARNCLVINNTVLDQNKTSPGPPWICIDKHKNGTASVNCVVRNNLATNFKNAAGVLQENNLRIQDPASLFVDPARFDLHLLPGAAAIDAGSSLDAPKLDRDRIGRPQGGGIDIGAYEWHANDVLPAEENGGGK